MDETLHKTLKRQIRKILGEDYQFSPELQSFLKAVSDTYEHFDEDRIFANHSMDEMSKEMLDINNALKSETADLEVHSTELEKMNKYMVDRELKMIELKKELRENEEQLEQFHKTTK
ncbi:MAG: hypothetical protein WC791_00930 [Candidatus Paceibacterota bacterium]|jgi:hypothetical protein